MKVIKVKPGTFRLFYLTKRKEEEMREYIKKNIPFVFKYKNKYFTTIVKNVLDCKACCFREECEESFAATCPFDFDRRAHVIGKEVPEYQVLFGDDENESD